MANLDATRKAQRLDNLLFYVTEFCEDAKREVTQPDPPEHKIEAGAVVYASPLGDHLIVVAVDGDSVWTRVAEVHSLHTWYKGDLTVSRPATVEVGDFVQTPKGPGQVMAPNYKGWFEVRWHQGGFDTYTREQLTILMKGKRDA